MLSTSESIIRQTNCLDELYMTSLTCQKCKVTVPRSTTRTQTICQFCGNFYNPLAGPSLSARDLDRLRGGSDPDRTRFPSIENHHNHHHRTGPLRAIGSYFANKLNLAHSFNSDVLRPSSDTSLPPIAKDAQGRLVTLKSPAIVNERVRTTKSEGELRYLSVDYHPNTNNSEDIEYPERTKTKEEFVAELKDAKANQRFHPMKRFYSMTFDSFQEINAAFKADPSQEGARIDTPDLRDDYFYAVCDAINDLSQGVQKCLLKAIINALMQKDQRLHSKDDTRAFFILLQNPVFSWQSSYPVLGHVLRQTCALSSGDHQLLMHWSKRLEDKRMRNVTKNLLQFITIGQFTPPAELKSPSHGPRKWWIPSATKVLALFNAANNLAIPSVLPYTEFYNSALDHADLMTEYHHWQNPDRPDRFSYCQYPFILSIVAKRSILQRDSEQQMVWNARRSLVATVIQNETPNLDIFFLNIHVRRSQLVIDSLQEIARKQKDLKKKLKVTFEGEPGLDMGGLTKEWFLLLIRQIFHQDYGMFVYHPESCCYWFSITSKGNLREYNLIGVLMGLAVYNSITLDVRFPFVCYKKLLSPPVVPTMENARVGICKNCSPADLAEIMPEVGRSLREVLRYEGDVQDMDLNFMASIEEFGNRTTIPLKQDGDNIVVTNENRQEFVDAYINWVINHGIYEQFKAFYLGFHSVCASNALIMLRPEEVEILVCGSPKLDMEELRKVTIYENCSADDPYIQDFWDVVNSFTKDDHKKFLLFTTGSDRVPVGGMGEMIFKISCTRERSNMLPISHTCFNQFVLPLYENKEVLREKLIIAINNAEGFGLE